MMSRGVKIVVTKPLLKLTFLNGDGIQLSDLKTAIHYSHDKGGFEQVVQHKFSPCLGG